MITDYIKDCLIGRDIIIEAKGIPNCPEMKRKWFINHYLEIYSRILQKVINLCFKGSLT